MSMTLTTLAYGAWPSPIGADMLAAQSVRLAALAMDGGEALWVEGRPSDGGRNVLVRATSAASAVDITAAPFNVRSRVHEYGGGAFAARDGRVWFINDDDQRVYRLDRGAQAIALTPRGPFRYADPCPAANGRGIVCVREEHREDGEPINCLVWIDGDGDGNNHGDGHRNGHRNGDSGVTVIAQGHDFFAYPRLSPDGQSLAFIAWDHPNMPWDGTNLYIAPVVADGVLGAAIKVAGGLSESIFQPHWSPTGQLWFVSDANGFWNLYRLHCDGRSTYEIECVIAESADYGMPLWQFAMSTYGFADADTLVAASCVQGAWRVQAIDLRDMRRTDLPVPISAVSALIAGDGQALLLGASATTATHVMRWTLHDNRVEQLRHSFDIAFASEGIAQPQTIDFPSADDSSAHGFFYAPTSSSYQAMAGERPPLIVIGHGGPTGATTAAFDLGVQFWTSRGFAVLDVNYRGSTGYGRKYRALLDGAWGIADVEDCVNGARYLAQAGLVDASRMAIRGRSAGGYTVLAALAFHDVFAAGASYYGIGELEALARDTHKFESRYMDRLVGPYPECAQIYRDRSPINHIDKLSCPVIFFQGLEDKVVPPNQAQMMRDALKAKGIAVACEMFAGEQHGFRRAETIVRTLQAELVFYGRVFGFEPAGELPQVQIDNL
ncbi:MAG: dipeptidyl aminopeptidase/acylaminoacyl peptidase [Gammaproteobacteria bacterium]|jgi:dipeptidyl aminopeptidase/acylaminoacyl peptidase